MSKCCHLHHKLRGDHLSSDQHIQHLNWFPKLLPTYFSSCSICPAFSCGIYDLFTLGLLTAFQSVCLICRSILLYSLSACDHPLPYFATTCNCMDSLQCSSLIPHGCQFLAIGEPRLSLLSLTTSHFLYRAPLQTCHHAVHHIYTAISPHCIAFGSLDPAMHRWPQWIL